MLKALRIMADMISMGAPRSVFNVAAKTALFSLSMRLSVW